VDYAVSGFRRTAISGLFGTGGDRFGIGHEASSLQAAMSWNGYTGEMGSLRGHGAWTLSTDIIFDISFVEADAALGLTKAGGKELRRKELVQLASCVDRRMEKLKRRRKLSRRPWLFVEVILSLRLFCVIPEQDRHMLYGA
jgi:hypothetical protein